jgi:hypothetical protein
MKLPQVSLFVWWFFFCAFLIATNLVGDLKSFIFLWYWEKNVFKVSLSVAYNLGIWVNLQQFKIIADAIFTLFVKGESVQAT